MIGNGSAPGCLNANPKPASCNISPDKDEEDFGDFEFRGESLLNLVQPELVSLSQHWLAALRDHALLSLPPGKPVTSCCASKNYVFTVMFHYEVHQFYIYPSECLLLIRMN
jgi:hypothetical protein